jgi:hypothetical protein
MTDQARIAELEAMLVEVLRIGVPDSASEAVLFIHSVYDDDHTCHECTWAKEKRETRAKIRKLLGLEED